MILQIFAHTLQVIRGSILGGLSPITVSTEFVAESPITPHIGNLHMTAIPHQHITDLKERRRTLQQRARSIRATTGLPYSSEVHLLLGQSYLDPASWQELTASRGVRAAVRRAQFVRQYKPLLARLEAAIKQYEQASTAQNSPGAERTP